MKSTCKTEGMNEELPKGKLTAKWVSSRNVIQIYLSGRYLTGASGEDLEDAIGELLCFYEVSVERVEQLKKEGYGYFIK